MKQKLLKILERWAPEIAGSFAFLVSFLINTIFIIDEQSIINCNTAIITLMSIIIGFVGVLIGIISTLRGTEEFKNFLSYKDQHEANRLKKYFILSITFGIITVLISLTLFFTEVYTQIGDILNVSIIYKIVSLSIALAVYSIFSTGRLFLFIISVLFYVPQDSMEDKGEADIDSSDMTAEEKAAFRKDHIEKS